MTQEERRLLLIDLCARLPYKTYIEIVDESGNIRDEVELAIQDISTVRYDESTSIRPYLRPLESMTMEEEREYISVARGMGLDNPSVLVDWLIAHRFDYRGLIEKGLALEAPADMYKTE